jgi:hypothetical protein
VGQIAASPLVRNLEEMKVIFVVDGAYRFSAGLDAGLFPVSIIVVFFN